MCKLHACLANQQCATQALFIADILTYHSEAQVLIIMLSVA